jgi:LCP family protein required for cell wall assembly
VVGVVAALVVLGAGTVLVNRAPGDSLGGALTTTLTNVLQGGKPENILLIGNNARDAQTPTAPGEADLIYVVHFDPQKHLVAVISVPRDTLVAFPGWNDPIPKIKSALLMGGASLEVQAVSKLLGMPIQGYVEADFAGFEAAINAVGGLAIDVPARLYDPVHSHANFYPGLQHMDGAEALAYVRIRQNQAGNSYRTNSFQRSDAGTQVMEALKSQVLAHESVGSLSHLLSVLGADFATNLSTTQLVGLLASADHAKIESVTVGRVQDTMTITSTAIPGVNTAGEITGASYDILTPAEIESVLAPFGASGATTGLPPLPAPSSVDVAVTDDADGQIYASMLTKAGFHVTLGSVPAAAGAPVIEYPAGDLGAAEAVGRTLGSGDETVIQAAVPVVTVQA